MSRRVVHLVALVVAGLALACNGEGESVQTATPLSSSSGTPESEHTATASAAVTQDPPSPAQPAALEEGAALTEAGVYLVETATGRLWRLEGGGAWSPDGKTLLSWGCCIGKGGLDVIEVPDGPAARIFDGDINTAAWSPDGGAIAFLPAQGSVLSPGIHVINRDGTALKRLSERTGWISWSPRGDLIAFQGDGLYLLEVATGDVNEIPDATQTPWYAGSVSWSPDGALLAFVNETGLYTYDPDTGVRHQIAAGPSAFPVWSPDGSRIVFRFGSEVPFAHTPEVTVQGPYVVDVKEGTEPKPLPMAATMSWSPDGSHIAYLEFGCVTGSWDIYTVAPDGASVVRLTTMPEGAKEGPYWSPTGATIAFSTFDKLMLLDAESGGFRTLAVSGGATIHLHGPVWSPDGRYIQFAAGFDHGICD